MGLRDAPGARDVASADANPARGLLGKGVGGHDRAGGVTDAIMRQGALEGVDTVEESMITVVLIAVTLPIKVQLGRDRCIPWHHPATSRR